MAILFDGWEYTASEFGIATWSQDSPQRPQSSQRNAEVFCSVVSVRFVVDPFFAADEEVDGLSHGGRKTGFTGTPPIVYDVGIKGLGLWRSWERA